MKKKCSASTIKTPCFLQKIRIQCVLSSGESLRIQQLSLGHIIPTPCAFDVHRRKVFGVHGAFIIVLMPG